MGDKSITEESNRLAATGVWERAFELLGNCIIKPDGHVVISTPNTTDMRSRIKFLLKGNLFWFSESAIGRFGHIMPIVPPIIRASAKDAGFRSVKMEMSRLMPLQ